LTTPAEVVWQLFVDESGNFSDASDDVVVAGVLARGDTPGLRSEELRSALEGACPGIPWPFHTCFLNAPAYLAICCAAFPGRPISDQAGHAQRAFREATDRAKSVLDADAPAEMALAIEGLRAGSLRFKKVKTLDDALKASDPDAHGVLLAQARQFTAQIGVLANRLARQAGGPWLALCCAGESIRGESGDIPSERRTPLQEPRAPGLRGGVAAHPQTRWLAQPPPRLWKAMARLQTASSNKQLGRRCRLRR